MLKKLVRYGNSNALVLDKAILELLNIAEGSVVKISTDGRSIILTPHQEQVSSQVIETVTSNDALLVAGVQESMQNYYKDLSVEQKATFGAELLALTKKHYELMISLTSQEDFAKEAAQIKDACQGNMAEFMPLYKLLRKKYAPEIPAIEAAIAAIHEKCKAISGGSPTENAQEEQKLMEQDMAAVFAKHKEISAVGNQWMSSPEYQHKAQLITEKFQGDLNSAEFMKEMKVLMYEFCPGMKLLHEDLEAVSKKYQQNNA
jgi:antitoxin component of MazEF toxin-antitoxin module